MFCSVSDIAFLHKSLQTPEPPWSARSTSALPCCHPKKKAYTVEVLENVTALRLRKHARQIVGKLIHLGGKRLNCLPRDLEPVFRLLLVFRDLMNSSTDGPNRFASCDSLSFFAFSSSMMSSIYSITPKQKCIQETNHSETNRNRPPL